jgi:sugar phosphate isomerase/epimerase
MEMTRRMFFAGAVSAGWLASAAAKRASKMKFGFTTYQWGQDWDVPTLIANCTKAKAFGVEVRTSAKYAHGIELDISAQKRRDVRKQFADSPVKLVGIATGERFDSPDPAKLSAAIENAKGYAQLSHDVGASGIRVFPNDFHKDVPEDTTIAQIAKALNEVGKSARSVGQQVRIENHGGAGRLVTLAKIFAQVNQPNVRVKLNGDVRDAENGEFAKNFALVKKYLGGDLHCRKLGDPAFPYQLQTDLLVDAGWDGWWLIEESDKVPDRVAALGEQREIFEKLVATSLKRG